MSNNLKEVNKVNLKKDSMFNTIFCANIDSVNISADKEILEIFSGENTYDVELLKRKKSGFRDDAKYFSLFGKSMENTYVDKRGIQKKSIPYIDIFAIHTKHGSTLRLMRPSANKDRYTLELAGLQQYNNKAENLVHDFQALWPSLQKFGLSRIDIAIDFFGPLPLQIEQAILAKRRKKVYENTTYYPTKKQTKKRNPYVNILVYNKTKKDKYLSENEQITRLEFSFTSFLKKFKFCDFKDAEKAMIKYIEKVAGIKISITDIKPKKPSCTLPDLELLVFIAEVNLRVLKERQKILNKVLFYCYCLVLRIRANNAKMRYRLEKMETTLALNNMKLRITQLEEEQEEYKIKLESIYCAMNNLYEEQAEIQNKISDKYVEWVGLAELAKEKKLGKDAIRKQLQSGDFEEGVDFKSDGNKIIVHQGAIERIQRKRRSSHG